MKYGLKTTLSLIFKNKLWLFDFKFFLRNYRLTEIKPFIIVKNAFNLFKSKA